VATRERGPAASQSGHPFTNFQWYFSRSRNTVFFGAYAREALSEAAFLNAVRAALALAPQLNWRQDDAGQRHVDVRPFPVEAIAAYAEVDSFDGFPDSVLTHGLDIFDDPALPCFRARCYVLKHGAHEGRRSFVLFQTSHALMEGADSSALVRGLMSVHEAKPKARTVGAVGRFGLRLAALAIAPANLVMARYHQGHLKQSAFVTMTVDRDSLKRAATHYGVQQRSILFGAVLYGIFHAAPAGPSRTKARLIGYTRLSARRFDGDDDFMKLRVHMARVKSALSFADYVRGLDALLEKDASNATGMQLLYNTVLGVHKRLCRLIPWAYDRKFFSFVPYDFVFSLVPPHLETGRFAGLRFEEIYCGTYTPGANAVIMVPYRNGLSFSFSVDDPMRRRLPGVAALLGEIGVPVHSSAFGLDRGTGRSTAVA
jgi:hypothetical protein